MPKAAVKVEGVYNSASPLSMGGLSADLPADHPCTVSKTPGRINIEFTYYKDKSLVSPFMTATFEQRQAQKKEELAKRLSAFKENNPKIIRVGPLKEEDGPGGKIVYFDALIDCSEYTHKERPEVYLNALAHTGALFVFIDIEGYLTGEEAKAFVVETMTNIAKADLSKL
jgi:hypothetical protein